MNRPRADQKPLVDYQAAWLRQLRKAYDTLLWQKGLRVRTPAVLGLMKSRSLWGRWIEGEGRLLLNENLILEHPWPAVLGILGHEMAHQLAGERPAPAGESRAAHGELFQFMGAKLGLDPFYLRATVDLQGDCPRPWPDRDAEPLPDDGARVLEKVRKLLALSGSPVAAEAQAAMKAAARLMARHNLDRLAEDGGSVSPQGYDYRLIELGAPRIDSRLGLIAHILARHFFVKTLFVPSYDPRRDAEGHDLEVMGRPENTRLAEHVGRFLLERSESLWQDYRRAHRGGGLIARNSFIGGLLRGFDQKLDEAAAGRPEPSGAEAGFSPAESSSGGFSALVLAKDRGLDEYFKKRHPRVRTRPSGGRRFCPESDRAGRAAGRALNLNRPLDEPRPEEGLYLPGPGGAVRRRSDSDA